MPPHAQATAEVLQRFAERRDRMLERAAPAPILWIGFGIILFNLWDRWLDPVAGQHTLWIRVASAVLLMPCYFLLRARRVHGIGARALHGCVFLIGILGVTLATLQVRNGFVWGAPGILMFPLTLAFYPLPPRWLIGLNIAALAAISVAAWHAQTPANHVINFAIMYGLSWWVSHTAARVLRKQQLRLFMLEHKHAEEARTDVLTGLLNRRFLEALGARCIDTAHRLHRPLAVLLVDLDHFKRINDTYGHDVGDQALVLAAQTLRHTLREVDHVGRWGGEEFVAILLDTDTAAAHGAAQRFLEDLRAAGLQARGQSIRLDASVGLASIRAGESFDALIRRADQAMYAAKAAGRGRVVIAESIAAP